jgi:hypothetical protein
VNLYVALGGGWGGAAADQDATRSATP